MVRRLFLMVCVAGLVVAGTADAATTGRLTGEVLDNQGLPLPGVTVQISSENLIGGPQIAISDADGQFAFNLLPPGVYTVEANLAGFQPAVGEVRVQLNRVASVTFNMVPQEFGEEVVVTAQVPVVDTTQVNTSVVFNEDYLQNAAVGAGGRDYLSVISQAAGVAGGGNASVYGGTEGDNAYLVDGLNTTDPLLGTFGTNFNYDAIQEINFQTGGFEAEFGQATGGIINLVTKSGGNEFSGSLDVRYRDETFTESGDHFDPDTQDSQFRNVAGTLGGPIVRDKVWFFISAENVLTEVTPANAFFTREYKGWNYIGKATWQASDSHRFVFKYSGDPAEIPGANVSAFTLPSAKGTQEQGGDIFQVELNSVLSEQLLVNAQVGIVRGFIEYYPSHGDLDRSIHINNDTGFLANAADYYSNDDRDRDEYRLNATYFVDDFGGAHELKAGIEYNDLSYEGELWFTGDARFYDVEPDDDGFVDLNGDGFSNQYAELKEPLDEARDRTGSTGDLYTFFVQDAWRPHSNVTVKPGIRLDNVQLTNHVGEDIADMDRWQPRFGVAWDIFGDAQHVVRASAGRFMDPTALSIPEFASGVTEIFHNYNTLEYYCNLTNGLICDPDVAAAALGTPAIEFTNGEGFTYYLFDNFEAPTIYEPANTVDQYGVGSLETPYADEFILAYEAQIAPETSVELSYIHKRTKEIIEDTCSNNTWAWGDGELPSLDDPTTWTSAGGCERFIIVNMPDFERKYDAYIAKFETRQENWHVLFSYTNADSRGNTFNGPRQSYATELADFYPVHFINREGRGPDQRDHRVKLNGYMFLPWDMTLGVDAFFSSEGYLTPTTTCQNLQGASQDVLDFYGVDGDLLQYCSTPDGAFLSTTDIFVGEQGSVETKSVWQLDLQLSKTFQFGDVDLTAVATVQNLFDREMDATFNSTAFRQTTEESGLGEPVNGVYYVPIGETLSYWLPRRYEVGLRLEF